MAVGPKSLKRSETMVGFLQHVTRMVNLAYTLSLVYNINSCGYCCVKLNFWCKDSEHTTCFPSKAWMQTMLTMFTGMGRGQTQLQAKGLGTSRPPLFNNSSLPLNLKGIWTKGASWPVNMENVHFHPHASSSCFIIFIQKYFLLSFLYKKREYLFHHFYTKEVLFASRQRFLGGRHVVCTLPGNINI